MKIRGDMALKIKDIPNVANFTVAACSLVGGAVATGGGVLALLTAGTVLLDCVRKNKRKTLQASIKKVKKACAEEAARIALVQGVSQGELDTVWSALNEAVYYTGASHEDIMDWDYDPETVATRMLERLAQKNELFKTSEFARDLAKGVLFQAFTAVRSTETYLLETEAYFRKEVLTGIASVKQAVEGIDQKVDVNTELSREILERLKNLEGASQELINDQSQASIEQTIKGLITAQKGARKRAGDKLKANPPDPQGAKIELLQLAAQQEDNVRDAAQTYLDIGNIAYMNDTHEALEAYIRVTELTPDDPEGWNNVGLLQDRLGALAKAEASYKKVLDLADQYNDEILKAVAYGNLGNVEQARGDLDTAVDYYQQALVLDKQLDYREGMAQDYGNLGIVEGIRGNLDAALGYFQKSLELDKQLGNKKGMANQYGNFGNVERMRGNLDAAVDYYQQALKLNKRLGSKEGMASAYGSLGIVEQIHGNLEDAVAYYQKSLKLEKQLGRKWGMASAYANLGSVEHIRGHLDKACGLWLQGYDLFVEIGAKLGIEQVGGWLSDAGCADAPEVD